MAIHIQRRWHQHFLVGTKTCNVLHEFYLHVANNQLLYKFNMPEKNQNG